MTQRSRPFSRRFRVADRWIGQDDPVYVIAEIGSNHNQDLDTAKRLIDAAAQAGANAAKFQSLRFDKVHHPPSCDASVEELYRAIELKEQWYEPLAQHCRDQGVDFLTSLTYLEAVDLAVKAGAPAIKIASAQFDIFPEIVDAAARTGLPMIMSAGLADLGGIERMLNIVQDAGQTDVVLLHCVSRYPAPVESVNLRFMDSLRRAFGCLVGYSDHTLGSSVATAAVALGAVVIEKHLTLDRNSVGPDHGFATLPGEFEEMVRNIRAVEQALGDGERRRLGDEEIELRQQLLYKWVTARSIRKGEMFDPTAMHLRRLPGGIERDAIEVIGRLRFRHDLPADVPVNWSDLEGYE